MPKRYKVRELIRMVEADGWQHVKTRGSHRQYKHPHKLGKVTIAGKPGEVLHPKTAQSILNQAQIEEA